MLTPADRVKRLISLCITDLEEHQTVLPEQIRLTVLARLQAALDELTSD